MCSIFHLHFNDFLLENLKKVTPCTQSYGHKESETVYISGQKPLVYSFLLLVSSCGSVDNAFISSVISTTL